MDFQGLSPIKLENKEENMKEEWRERWEEDARIEYYIIKASNASSLLAPNTWNLTMDFKFKHGFKLMVNS